ncbi:MAG: TlpA family protein disulfide reductase [Thaumarchaeota archaeon]|nr:TlpA family protein disulfide reductase [Nitrososphaerota archaeon]
MEKLRKKSGSKYIVGGIAAAIVIAVVLFLGINSSSQFIPSAGTTNALQSGVTEGLQVGNTEPDFILVDPQKGQITKQTFEGKPLVIYFMATWCVSCYIGVENFASYYDQSDKNFNVLLVSTDGADTADKLLQFQKVYGRPNWYIANGIPNMINTYHVTLLDTKYIIDKNGIIKWKGSDILDANSMGDVMKKALGV